MMETPSHHFRSQHIHSWWFGINTWKKIGQIVETCWNYIKVDPHIFPRIWLHVHSDLLSLTKVHPFCRAAHLPTYRKCMEMLGVGGIVKAFSTNFELTANGSTCINSNGIFFPVAYSANCEESYPDYRESFQQYPLNFLGICLGRPMHSRNTGSAGRFRPGSMTCDVPQCATATCSVFEAIQDWLFYLYVFSITYLLSAVECCESSTMAMASSSIDEGPGWDGVACYRRMPRRPLRAGDI